MSTKSYGDLLKDPRWQKKRLEIFKRDKFKCKNCKDTETTLHVHHLSYSGKPWEQKNDELITLCEHCHGVISDDNIDFKDIVKSEKIINPDGNSYVLNLVLKSINKVTTYYMWNNNVFRVHYKKNSPTIKSIINLYKYIE